MRISIAEAEGQLADLVKRAEQGEEVVLTQPGLSSVRLEVVSSSVENPVETYDAAAELAKLVPTETKRQPLSAEEKRKIFEEIRNRTLGKDLLQGTSAARSQDFLYDEFGLPK
ncbi:prevent-host-death family protein [Rhizobium sp. NFR07]|jgi:prevent-host-death family protein|uniref:type II toxin-antitoxin system Phd/YefM family antitoxin n=1 Tax=Rhizobium sp. NFR07 TaxID=1566262 RepID=UPI0008E055AC|nr:type II toxin-antitoxin system prevent-host-death family antitoxin [Rhizobium sp. NFR07]SFB20863.1 prevent-host-death family protein [Rhizobium sp. NFR07]